jgi:hypothetical protein
MFHLTSAKYLRSRSTCVQSCCIRIATMHTGERSNQKMNTTKKEPSTLTPTTKTTWKGRYTCKVHTSQDLRSRSNCGWSSTLPTYRPKLPKKPKNKGSSLGKQTKKVILRTNFPLFGLQHAPTSPLLNPPPLPPYLGTVSTAVAVHTVPRTRSQTARK